MSTDTIRDRLNAAGLQALWDSDTTAAFLGVPPKTLHQWAYRGVGPAFSKVGRYRRYRPADVEAYVTANRHGGAA